MDLNIIAQNADRIVLSDTEPLIIGAPPEMRRAKQERTPAISVRRPRRRMASLERSFYVASAFAAATIGIVTWWSLARVRSSLSAVQKELPDQKLLQAMAEVKQIKTEARFTEEMLAAALAQTESQTAGVNTTVVVQDDVTAFVFVGSCGDAWTQDTFEDLPLCQSGDIMVRRVERLVRAKRNMTLRSSPPSNGKLGPKLDVVLRAGQQVRLLELMPMSTISDPPRLYWAKIQVKQQ